MYLRFSWKKFSALLFIMSCKSNNSRVNYADVVVPPSKALPACAITDLDTPTAGLRPFANFTADSEVLDSAIRTIQRDTKLGPVYDQAIINPSIEKFSKSLNISKEEVALLYTYTNIGDTYYNAALRKGGILYDRWRDAILGVVSTLNKVSSKYRFKGEVYRFENVSLAEFNLIKEKAEQGAVFGEYGFLSSSQRHDVALQWGYSKMEKNPSKSSLVIYRIKSKTGVNIDPFSHFENEAEVLFLPSTAFRVKQAKMKKIRDKDYLEIVMEEIAA